MQDNRVTIHIEDNQISVRMHKHIAFPDFVQIWTNGLRTVMESVLQGIPPDYYDEVKADMYNLVNVAASSLLSQFAPELEPNPEFNPKEELIKQNTAIFEAFEKLKAEGKI